MRDKKPKRSRPEPASRRKPSVRGLRFITLSKKELREKFIKQRQAARERRLAKNLRSAFGKFRPKKSERGSVVFINRAGQRGRSGRVGYGVYVDTKGKKHIIRQYDRKSRKIERVPAPRKVSAIDVSRVRNKGAKKKFLQAHVNPVAAGSLRKIRSKIKETRGSAGHVPADGTRFAGKSRANSFWTGSEIVKKIGGELLKAFRTTKSNKDFLVTLGIHVKKGRQRWFFSTQRRIARKDAQPVTLTEIKQFLGHEIYAFIATELLAEGLVMAGSAAYISRLKENKKKKREDWTKDGFEWGGAGAEDVEVTNVEWRFDQNTFRK